MTIADFQLRHDVVAELDWDTRLDSRQIGVAVKNGVVSLSGYVSTYAQRLAAQKAAQSVLGVRAVANDIVVEPAAGDRRSDAEIADLAESTLRSNISVPADNVKLVVCDGWIQLDGEVAVWYQRHAAECALVNLPGVKGVMNNILVSAAASASDVQSRIQEAIHRRAQLDARNVIVKCEDGTVTLEGEVHSWDERVQAETAAWQAPGVSNVVDHLEVRP